MYHSIHDNFDWMTRFVDHDFRYHETIAKLWMQLALSLADGILLPFNIRRYGENLLKQAEAIEKIKNSAGKAKDLNTGNMPHFSLFSACFCGYLVNMILDF